MHKFAIVHVNIKDNFTKCLFEFVTKKLYEMPENYMEYDAKNYRKKTA